MLPYLPPEILNIIYDIKKDLENYDRELERFTHLISYIKNSFIIELTMMTESDSFHIIRRLFLKFKPDVKAVQIVGEGWFTDTQAPPQNTMSIHVDNIKYHLKELFIETFSITTTDYLYKNNLYQYLIKNCRDKNMDLSKKFKIDQVGLFDTMLNLFFGWEQDNNLLYKYGFV